MTTPRPKRHVNRRNFSHEPIADYVDPPGTLLKPSNLSAGTICNFPRNPLDAFCPDGSPPSKIDDITGNLTTLSSNAGTSYLTAAIASSTVIGSRSPSDKLPPPPNSNPDGADIIMQANDDDAASTASTEASIFGGANELWENQYRQIRRRHQDQRRDL